ncbi:RING-H2 finger protein [Nymphaea thermarum]|nr:RING-H2 finger protein [Nymphaea thermarum]
MSNNTGSSGFLDVSPEIKLYQAFVVSVPIIFTFILLFLFYLFYLRRRRVDWSSLRMRTSYQAGDLVSTPSGLGMKKEIREMLPIVIYKESFLIRETHAVRQWRATATSGGVRWQAATDRCSDCLGDYEPNDHLQQIPSCGHTFHMDCIDNWLTKHTTCPLCRASLLPATKAMDPPSTSNLEAGNVALERVGDDVVAPSQNSGTALHL